MDIPEDVVISIRSKQGVVDVYTEQTRRAAGEALDTGDAHKQALAPSEFPEKYLVPLCFFVEDLSGVWLGFLGGKKEKFEELERREKDASDECIRCERREREAKQALRDYIDQYLRTADPLYKKRSEVLEAIKAVNGIAEIFYNEAEDIRCDLIGFNSPREFEKIRAEGMERMKKLLPRAVEDLKPWKSFLRERVDDGYVCSYIDRLSLLCERLSACSLNADTMSGTEAELDAILAIMMDMTNMTRYPD